MLKKLRNMLKKIPILGILLTKLSDNIHVYYRDIFIRGGKFKLRYPNTKYLSHPKMRKTGMYSQCGQDVFVYETFFKGKKDGVDRLLF